MTDPSRTNQELIEELSVLKQRIRELELSDSERKQAESQREAALKALRESEEKYRVLFEGINDAVFVHDLDKEGQPGRFLQVNDVACRRLGYRGARPSTVFARSNPMPKCFCPVVTASRARRSRS